MTYEEAGELLKEGRIRHKLSLEEVAEALKISSRFVGALESGNVEMFPHAVYLRGMVRSYIKLLNIDDELSEEILAVYIHEEVNEFANPPIILKPKSKINFGMLFLVLICAMCFLAFWYYNTYYKANMVTSSVSSGANNAIEFEVANADTEKKQDDTAQDDSTNLVSDASTQMSLSEDSSERDGEQASEKALGQAPRQASELSEKEIDELKTSIENLEMPKNEDPSANSLDEKKPIKPQGFVVKEGTVTKEGSQKILPAGVSDKNKGDVQNLIVHGLEECWVYSGADNTDTREFTIKPGDVFSLSFRKKLELKLGNAGGVRLTLNGKDLGAVGKVGEVKTLTFPLS